MSQSQFQTNNRLSQATDARDWPWIAAGIGAIALHAAIVIATLFTWSHRLDIADESAAVVPVDLVTIAPKTNIIASAPPAPKVPPQVTPVQAPPPPAAQPVTPPQEDTEPPPVDTAPSEPLIKAPPPPPVPKLKPQTQPLAKKPAADPMKAILDQLTTTPAPAPSNAKASSHATKGFGPQTAMNADLKAMLQSQIYNCWTPQSGVPDPSQLIVDLEISLNPDGSVAQAPQLTAQSAAAAASNSYTRAAAEEARRAVVQCAPYRLPADQYGTWRAFTFRFDPGARTDQ